MAIEMLLSAGHSLVAQKKCKIILKEIQVRGFYSGSLWVSREEVEFGSLLCTALAAALQSA